MTGYSTWAALFTPSCVSQENVWQLLLLSFLETVVKVHLWSVICVIYARDYDSNPTETLFSPQTFPLKTLCDAGRNHPSKWNIYKVVLTVMKKRITGVLTLTSSQRESKPSVQNDHSAPSLQCFLSTKTFPGHTEVKNAVFDFEFRLTLFDITQNCPLSLALSLTTTLILSMALIG